MASVIILEIMEPKFFKKPEDFKEWLAKHHTTKEELYVGYYKKATGKPSMTWPESVDEALCFGWIDGIRKKVDDESYMIRFTPRRPDSIWSAVNLKKIEELKKKGLMQKAGLAVYEKRKPEKSEGYSFEQKKAIKLPDEFEALFKKNKKAWTLFKSMAPYYQRTATWWVISAKKEETRLRRLNTLIEDSENKLKVKPLRS